MEPNINTPRMQPSDETLTAQYALDSPLSQWVLAKNTFSGSPDEFGRTSTHNSYTQPKDHAIAENDDMFDFARIPTRHSLQRRNSINRTSTRGSLRQTRTRNSREIVDPESLPYRALSNEADFNEYTQEVPGGEILKIVKTKDTQQFERYDLVAYTIGDKANPKNWSKLRRWYITMVVGFVTFVAAFCSSVITADIAGVSETFHVSEEVSLLTITVFVVGFGIALTVKFEGPLLFAPLSEMYGRWVIYATTLLPAVIFIIPGAVAKNIGTLIVVRAIDGIAFSAPITLVGGTLSDIWKNEDRAPAMAAFSAAVFCGPAIGPLCGGFLSDAAGWRWLYWLQLILAAIAWFLITFTVPETYTPTILATKAAKMRKETGNERYVTEQELDKRPIMDRLYLFLLRPFQYVLLLAMNK
ncbi:MAG: hypothetical protein M1834_003570 [Cirrosporium novae-zelandiae]|nr:MAG: hypothetical protein M1834_003570 [Cirrosporium novae-zelandiae]